MQPVSPRGVQPAGIPGFCVLGRLYACGPRVVYLARREADGAEVVLKTLSGDCPRRRDVAELRREFQIVRRLDLDGVIEMHALWPYGAGNLAIEMDYFGLSLADLLAQRGGQPLPPRRVLGIAVDLARIIGRLHERDVVHKDIVPHNVLIDPATDALRLIDFGIASELTRERQSPELAKRLRGSLPYISPEQTGRMNRDLDYRSDYYSLGVTLFELATGRLPFSADLPIEWVHRHISQPPPAAHAINPALPEALSRILAKLMRKDAEDRYQSTYGLIVDLELCRDLPCGAAALVNFEPGRADVSRRFAVPQQLYGREQELARLTEMFDDASAGTNVLCLVSGWAGVGKSALVNELGKSIIGRRGWLIQGKFDQFQRNNAYAAFVLAFRDLVRHLLGEPAERLVAWRERLQATLGRNARLMIDQVPELEPILGPCPPVPDLPPTEARNRLQLVFTDFVKALAGADHPLVVFMDDLQWSDLPTLALIERLATVRDLSHLLIIGAYRSSAVDDSHPLRVALSRIQQLRALEELRLQPLTRDAVQRLTADTLHAADDDPSALVALIYDKAGGNPFFTGELLKGLKEQRAIAFDPEAGRWGWDMDAVRRAEVADNVVDFMVANLRRLPAATRQVMQLAACIGNSFDLRTLALIHGQPMADTSAALSEALRRQMVVPLGESYKYIGGEPAAEPGACVAVAEGTGDDDDEINPGYRFQHDRIQQAAYALIDAERRQAVHLSIGRQMQRHASGQADDAGLMQIVSHLNLGRRLIDDRRERHLLAELNRRAGLKAQRSSAYQSALDLFAIGQELLGEQPWEQDRALMMALSREYQQCAYLTGDHAEAERWTDIMLQYAQGPLEQAELLSARTRQYATIGKLRESIQVAIAGLALLGVDITDAPGRGEIEAERALVDRLLGGRRIADLIDAPALSDPATLAAVRLLMEIFPAAFLSGSGDLFPYLVLKSVNLSLRHGNSPESAFTYAAYGMLLCGALDDPARGYEFGRLALAMNERCDDIALKSRVIYLYTMFIHHWSHHWASMTPWFLKGIEAGYQSGDLLYLAYSAQDCVIWDPTLDLETASREQRKYLAIVRDCDYRDSYDSGRLFLQMQLNMQGLTDGLYSLNDAEFDEAMVVAGMRRRRFMTGIANYHIYKAEIHCLYGDHAGALRHVREQEPLIAASMSLPQLVRFRLVAFLTRAAVFVDLEPAEQAATLARLQAEHGQMLRWAQHCAENFHHLSLMMAGELLRLDGRLDEALQRYEQAIAAARASGFLRDEATANELAANCLLRAGLERAAEGYLRAACRLYERWGARRKVGQMELRHAQVLGAPPARARGGAAAGFSTATTDALNLDLGSVMKASRAISSEIVLEQLWQTTMQILLENAGGEYGCLVVSRDDHLQVMARARSPASIALQGSAESTDREHERAGAAAGGRAAPNGPTAAGPLEPEPEAFVGALPLSIINSVLRTGAPLVLSDARQASRFATDPYVVARQPLSVMCVPILRRERCESAIYMENNQTTGAFTDERVEIINLLSAQAAISLENARLYEEQLELTAAQRRFVPSQFLEILGRHDIAAVGLGEHVSKEMSVMFSDLRDFTPLAERLGPRAMIELLNRYFSRLSDPIARAGGFIDSFNGDEIMALFDGSADAALQAGIQMHHALAAFNLERVAGGEAPLQMGTGLNTGHLVLGTVGAQDRLQCGVVGDTVNTASRIEQLTKRYRAPLLIGEPTYRRLQAPERFSVRRIDRVAVKGRLAAIELFEVLDAETPERRAAKEATRDGLHAAMEHYQARRFQSALALLRKTQTQDANDAVLTLFIERAARYARQPPPRDWPGFELLTSK